MGWMLQHQKKETRIDSQFALLGFGDRRQRGMEWLWRNPNPFLWFRSMLHGFRL